MSDLRPPLALALAVFGVPVTVTRPGEAPVVTTGIWLAPVPVQTDGVLLATAALQRVLSLPRAALPTVPRGTQITAPETADGAVATWAVEAVLGQAADEVRVAVVPVDES